MNSKIPRFVLISLALIFFNNFLTYGSTMEKCDFTRLSLPKYEETPCSPKLAGDFVGIRLRAPEKIVKRNWGRIPVCGAYSAPLSFRHTLIESVVLVVVDKNDGSAYSFNLKPDKESEDDESGSGEDLNFPDYINITVYFNVDIRSFCPDLPVKETSYFVYAILGPYKSNTVEIELAAK